MKKKLLGFILIPLLVVLSVTAMQESGWEEASSSGDEVGRVADRMGGINIGDSGDVEPLPEEQEQRFFHVGKRRVRLDKGALCIATILARPGIYAVAIGTIKNTVELYSLGRKSDLRKIETFHPECSPGTRLRGGVTKISIDPTSKILEAHIEDSVFVVDLKNFFILSSDLELFQPKKSKFVSSQRGRTFSAHIRSRSFVIGVGPCRRTSLVYKDKLDDVITAFDIFAVDDKSCVVVFGTATGKLAHLLCDVESNTFTKRVLCAKGRPIDDASAVQVIFISAKEIFAICEDDQEMHAVEFLTSEYCS